MKSEAHLVTDAMARGQIMSRVEYRACQKFTTLLYGADKTQLERMIREYLATNNILGKVGR